MLSTTNDNLFYKESFHSFPKSKYDGNIDTNSVDQQLNAVDNRMLQRMERKYKPQKKKKKLSDEEVHQRGCGVCAYVFKLFWSCKLCCTALCEERVNTKKLPQNTSRIVSESPVGEQLKTLSEKFENPLSSVPEVSIVSENQRLPRRLSDSSFMAVFSDEDSIFEDDIFFAGAFHLHSYQHLGPLSLNICPIPSDGYDLRSSSLLSYKIEEGGYTPSIKSSSKTEMSYIPLYSRCFLSPNHTATIDPPSSIKSDKIQMAMIKRPVREKIIGNETSPLHDNRMQQHTVVTRLKSKGTARPTEETDLFNIDEPNGAQKITTPVVKSSWRKHLLHAPLYNKIESTERKIADDRTTGGQAIGTVDELTSGNIPVIDFSTEIINFHPDCDSFYGGIRFSKQKRAASCAARISNKKKNQRNDERKSGADLIPPMSNSKNLSCSRSVASLIERRNSSRRQKKKDALRVKAMIRQSSAPNTPPRGWSTSNKTIKKSMGSSQHDFNSTFIEDCYAFVQEKKMYDPPISVDAFMDRRVDSDADMATRTTQAWAYLSCFPPWRTTPNETVPMELDLNPGVIVRLLASPKNRHKDPMSLDLSWELCSKGLLHLYRSRYAESNCCYHLYRVWKEMLEMEPELTKKLKNLIALGNHPDWSVYRPHLSEYGAVFSLAMNEFASNILLGAKIAKCANVLADQSLEAVVMLKSAREVNTKKTFQDVINSHQKANPSFEIEGYQLYEQAKLLSACIFKYFSEYVTNFEEGNVIFRPGRIHSRSHYEMLSDIKYDRKWSVDLSVLSAPMLVSNWLSANFYFEYPRDIIKFLELLHSDANVEVVSIVNEVETNSSLTISLIISNLDSFGKPDDAKMLSFFLELQLKFSWEWYLKHQTFRLGQIARCEPQQLLQSQILFKQLE